MLSKYVYLGLKCTYFFMVNTKFVFNVLCLPLLLVFLFATQIIIEVRRQTDSYFHFSIREFCGSATNAF